MMALVSDERITTINGEPVIRETRVPVARILERVAQGKRPEEVVAEWPDLALDDVRAALEYAVATVRGPVEATQAEQLDGMMGSGGSPAMDLDKVLVVDDQEDNLYLIDRILTHKGFTVSLASNGEQALAKARAELPFVILSDIMMPEMDGFELCQRLKADERTKDAAVIFITAGSYSSEKVSKGLEMGADDYLARPIQNRELVARVQAVARLKRAEVEARHRAYVVARRNKELSLLNYLALTASSFSSNLWEVFVSSMPGLCQLLDAEAVAWFLLEGEWKLQVSVVSNTGKAFSDSSDFRPRSDVTPQVFQEQVSLVLTRVFSENSLENAPPLDLSVIYFTPVTGRNGIIGAIAVVPKQGVSLTDEDRMLLDSVAGIAAMAVDNSRLFAEVQEFNRQLEHRVEERTQQLVEEEGKMAAILANMADGLLVLDAENRILAANRVAEEMLDFRLDDLQGQPVGEDLLSFPLWSCVNDMAASRELTLCALVALPDTTRPGDTLSVEARSTKMWGEEGQPTGTVIVLRDITALKEVERMKARFMAGVTHELKTPLAVIRVHADNLSNYFGRLQKRKRAELLKTIQKQVVLLERWVEDILELTRLDAGAMEMDRRLIDLGSLTDEVLAGRRQPGG